MNVTIVELKARVTDPVTQIRVIEGSYSINQLYEKKIVDRDLYTIECIHWRPVMKMD